MSEAAIATDSQIEATPKEDNKLAPTKYKIDFVEIVKNYECKHPGCLAAFSKPAKLIVHERQHTGDRPFECDWKDCDKAYTSSSHLKRHRRSHEEVKKGFQCEICLRMLSNIQNLRRHEQRVHDDAKYPCEECGLKFRKEIKYKEHQAVHRGIILYKCKECPREFTSLYYFKKHEFYHYNKTYPCDVTDCSEVFDKWSLLCKHKKLKHHQEYKCKNCDKTFLYKHHLRIHSEVHGDDRTILPCPYEKCPRFYFFKRNLDHHVRTNHMGEKYQCDTCDLKFSTKQKIAEHINLYHMPKRKRKKRKLQGRTKRAKRKDAGTVAKSTLSQLVGLDLPRVVEKQLMNRKTRIQLGREDVVENSQSNDDNHGEIEVVALTLTNEFEKAADYDIENNSLTILDENEIINESCDQIAKQLLQI